MNIPDEAVEAAANELHDREGYSISLADSPKYRKDYYRALATEVLEAAAPYMLAQAWDEGREADDFEVSIGFDANPYRSQA